MKDSKTFNENKIYIFIKKNILYVLIIVFILLITELVYCNEDEQCFGTNYYYSYDNDNIIWTNEKVLTTDDSFDEQLDSFFLNYFNSKNLICMPINTEFLDTYYNNGNLFINLSEDVLIHGGTLYESVLLNQIFRTALSIDGVDTVTILINDSFICMPEGINTFFVTEYDDLSSLN